MNKTGKLNKMRVELESPVRYSMILGDQEIPINDAIGKTLTLKHTNEINCVHCDRKTKKSFSQGYCYPCFRKLAQCDMCIVKPELCHYEAGTCREPQWGEDYCLQPHYVYLANSSGVKVGITRGTQIPTRWIDQGAVAALPIFQVSERLLSGLVETELKQYVSDKTSWQKMLKGNIEPVDLVQKRDELLEQSEDVLSGLIQQFGEGAIEFLENEEPISIEYPVLEYPKKVKSFNFDKTPEITGTLMGIKGQYLIFDTGVINIRKFGGYQVQVIF